MSAVRRYLHEYRYVFIICAVAAIMSVYAAVLLVQNNPAIPNILVVKLQDFLTIALSILIEATPFLLLGVLVSLVVQYYIPARIFHKIIPKNKIGRRLVLSFVGVALPVCECGNVPVARSLMHRGLSPGDAITFLLAAPILNPIVLLTTWQAFRFEESVIIGRFLAAFIIANLVAIIVCRFLRKDDIITPDFAKTCKEPLTHNHSPTSLSIQFTKELWPLLRLLCFGALIAAATQIFIPRDILFAVGADPILSIIAMVALGFVISICSSVDAFFALAYARAFNPGSLTAFLVAGPMIDIKMIALLKTTFTMRAIMLIGVLVCVFSILTGLIINYLVL